MGACGLVGVAPKSAGDGHAGGMAQSRASRERPPDYAEIREAMGWSGFWRRFSTPPMMPASASRPNLSNARRNWKKPASGSHVCSMPSKQRQSRSVTIGSAHASRLCAAKSMTSIRRSRRFSSSLIGDPAESPLTPCADLERLSEIAFTTGMPTLAKTLRGHSSARSGWEGVSRYPERSTLWREQQDALPGQMGQCPALTGSGAVEKTRTSTGFRPQRPQRCASTSSATTALGFIGGKACARPAVGARP